MKKFRLFMLLTLILSMAIPMLASAQDGGDDETPLIGFWEECEDPVELEGEVNLGVIFALTGSAAVYGTSQQNGVMLALEEINESGYLGENATLNVIVEDGSDAETSLAAMEKLVHEDGVPAVIGPTLSAHAFAADPVAQEAGVVVLGVSNTANGITDMGDYIFRDSLPESAVIPGNLAIAVEELGIETVGVMYSDDDDFSVSGYNVFTETLDELGVEVIGTETFKIKDTDFNAQLTNLVFEDIDALVVSTLAAEATLIIQQARELGYEGPIIGGNGFNSPAIVTNAGEAANGVVVGAAWHISNESELNQAFIDMYTEAYEVAPDQFAAQAYTGLWLMATAIRCGDSAKSTDIHDNLASITDFDSPLGLFSFDENRDPVHDPVSQIIVDGKFELLGGDEEGDDAEVDDEEDEGEDTDEEGDDDSGDDEDTDDPEATEEAE